MEKNIKARKERETENKYLDDLLEKALENTEVEVPHAMIHEEIDRMIRELERKKKRKEKDFEM